MLGIMKKNKTKINKKAVLLLAVGACTLVAGIFLFQSRDNGSRTSNGNFNEDSLVSGSNLEPPTSEDLQRSEDNKQSLIDEQKRDSAYQQSQNGSKNQIRPIVTYAGVYDSQFEIGGYAPVFEQHGTFTLIMEKDGKKITRTVAGVRNSTSTDCPAIVIPLSEITQKGMWSVSLSYESPTSTGISEVKQVSVQ